ncbi:hypothetical protein C7212DRAFT_276520 [Tuber magnatum]|uniref:CID domain-containing protein n=1 Tax=Tuber magnatum TaxID=42249 RepID=A0A317SVS8_9PEZI|nr:hypothetical protein C7212DRAFT_276520 [Tuber magnatum]
MASAVSHQVAIARASLAAGLLRPDPTAVSRDEISNFHTLLEQALSKCSPSNIQNCKRWILRYMNSRARFAALGKFLAALSPSLSTSTTAAGKTSARRKRANILYLVNDLLHHTTYNEPSDGLFAEEVNPFLADLFVAAMYPGAVKQLAKLEKLLDIWVGKGYYTKSFIEELKFIVKDATSAAPTARSTTSTDSTKAKVSVEKPLLLPPFHGDPSLPFYDLPAANMLPHLIPNSPTPINPRLMKPIQFSTLVPNESLAAVVKDFIRSVDDMFNGDDAVMEDPDAIGGGGGESYYGWSRDFCEKMKQKQRAALKERRNSRRRSYSYSPDASQQGRSPSYYSRSRSHSRDRGRRSRGSDSRSRSPSSRSSSRSCSRSRSRSRSRSAERSSFQQQPRTQPNISPLAETHQYPHQLGYPAPPPPLPPHHPPQQYYRAQPVFPPPPPPPTQNWNMAHAQQQQQQYYQQQQQQYPYNYSGPPPPPPPPPPPSAPGTQQHQYPPSGAQGWQPPQGQSQGGAYTQQYEDYRSVKGREISAKRGWKT